ncbi:AraC family transcriptional regulator [Kordia sp.]|uniref:AraC family transcriptional regulator n=1 Tax=Kordia sp. TaxID=1965332 RepID=UPI0025C37016|nr:AraC family transcriptional regulator [Kordia sp.]MCH2192610.1 helix-turn-helix domain-containing protein [Kordia sp.]
MGIIFFLIGYNSFSQQTQNTKETKEQTLKRYIDLARELQIKEKYQKSIAYSLDAAILSKELNNDSLLFRAYMQLGKSYLYSWNNEKAIEAYYNALKVAKKNEDIDHELKAYSGLIAFLPTVNKKDKAVNFSLYALTLVDKSSIKNTVSHVKLLTVICDAFLAKEDYETMLSYVNTGIHLAEELHFDAGLVDLYIKKGKYYRHQQKWEEAFYYLYKSKDILEEGKIESPFFPTINTSGAIAGCYYDQEKYDEAIQELLNSTVDVKKEDEVKDNMIKAYELLADCYKKKENYKEVAFFLDKVNVLKDTARARKDAAVNRFHEEDSNNLLSEIEALQHQGKEQKKTISYMWWVILLVAIAFLLISFLYIKKQKANRATFNTLIEKITTLEANKKSIASDKPKSKTKNIRLDDETIKSILTRLEKLEEQEYFLKSTCNLRSVAKKIKTNSTYLSQIINKHKEKSFNDYISDLRIEYVLKRLKNDEKFRMFSIKAIATEIGYKSADSFVKHFKKKTELNPSYYIKQLNKMDASEN